MDMQSTRYRTYKMVRALQDANRQLFVASRELQAFGLLIGRQSEDEGGFVELHGLGFALEEIGAELFDLWKELDTANFVKS